MDIDRFVGLVILGIVFSVVFGILFYHSSRPAIEQCSDSCFPTHMQSFNANPDGGLGSCVCK